jgi:cyclo(L-tyrosyl-L-tyrosyl) synthase
MDTSTENKVTKLSIQCIDKASEEIFKRGQHVVVGISSSNSYYSEKNIYNTIQWAKENFKDLLVFAADGISYYNFLSRGYTEKEAQKKTKHQDGLMRNRIFRSFDALDIPREKLILWEDKKLDPNYQKLADFYAQETVQNMEFMNIIDHVIHSIKLPIKGDGVINKEIAMRYAILELPFLLHTISLFDVPESCFIYHENNPFMDYIYTEGRFRDKGQGFMAVNFQDTL